MHAYIDSMRAHMCAYMAHTRPVVAAFGHTNLLSVKDLGHPRLEDTSQHHITEHGHRRMRS